MNQEVSLFSKKQRIISFDLIRIIAACAVVLLHAAASFALEYPTSSMEFLVGNIFNSISRLAVPLFLMLSGALMLNENKNNNPKKMFGYALHIAILLCLWSLFYATVYQILYPLVAGQEISFVAFLKAFVNGHFHLWYLFMMIGLYLITPILRLFVRKENAKYIAYFILLSLVFKFSVPILNYLGNNIGLEEDFIATYMDGYKMSFVGEYVTYYLTGWYLTNIEVQKKHRIITYILGIVGLLTTILGTHFFYTDAQTREPILYSTLSINTYFYAIAVFLFIYTVFQNKECSRTTGVARELSNLTFGVYLIHPVILNIIHGLLNLTERLNIQSVFLQLQFDLVVTLVCSFAATWLLSKIPLIKKLIKC